MRCCLVLQFEVKLYTSQRNSSQQLLGYQSRNTLQYNLYQPELFTFTLRGDFLQTRVLGAQNQSAVWNAKSINTLECMPTWRLTQWCLNVS